MNLFRQIPKVDKLLKNKNLQDIPENVLIYSIHSVLDELREKIKNSQIDKIDEEKIINNIVKKADDILSPSLINVINATGVTIHTNLGRSLIDEEIFNAAKKVSTHYCNLEYDLNKGKRGDRYHHSAKHLSFLFNCEDALIVNNNAAAVFLILNTFAKEREVVVSRGELVEIGGSFRVPEVMKASGAKLVEIGTTNKTKLKDYEESINENTAMLMKVHKSNYTIEGFTEEVYIDEIIKLSRKYNLLDYYDLGSAYIPKLPYGLSNTEPSINDIMKLSPSLVSFSGDKLFGGVQAGIIIGKKELINKLKKNQILRMFRVDKITLSLIQATTLAYIKKEYEKIPTLKQIFTSIDTLKQKAKKILSLTPSLRANIKESKTYVGGGTMPNKEIPTVVIEIEGNALSWERKFREKLVIGRIENDRFVLDMRTIQDDEIEKLASIINELISCEVKK
ncbi:L-seryl-tRNA(Ser) seleniumtransferase [Lebetimonas natsushimae]|uniref:L-seryl-tRNA(Sec) selenium transferase n=1 Tax=Lebetimonas natsushimae TaxID=1936991 RepID=A0A292YCX8_9BACT|nr:L-seryl-tRNA(Sec) selenium transferase [Lebetimonas natsushimae]GAX87175.1 L-seryl-tRNA(Ser) seleniumtransferase [Lebetimonas natsushimae]